ncbi:MAG: hypothetical protein RR307_02220 [Clostridia bacterium]
MKIETQTKIEYLTQDFRAVAKYGDKTIIVDNALPNEIVNVCLTDRRDDTYYGNITSVGNPSLHRVEPLCPLFYECGNCALQYVANKRQLTLKKEAIEALIEQGGLQTHINATQGLFYPYKYRNRITLNFGHKGDKITIGYANNNGKVVDISTCAVCEKWVDNLITTLRTFCGKFKVRSFSDDSGMGSIKSVTATCVKNKLMLMLNVADTRILGGAWLYKELALQFKGGVAMWLKVEGEQANLVGGERKMYASICGIDVLLEPQLRLPVNEKLYGKMCNEIVTKINTNFTVVISEFNSILASLLQKSGVDICEYKNDNEPFSPKSKPSCAIVESQSTLKESTLGLLERMKTKNLYCIISDCAEISQMIKSLINIGYTPISITPYDMLAQTKKISALIEFKR